MPTTTTIPGQGSQAAAEAPMTTSLACQGGKFLSWKALLVQSLARELHALHIQQQERAFMATSHGLNYCAAGRETAALH